MSAMEMLAALLAAGGGGIPLPPGDGADEAHRLAVVAALQADGCVIERVEADGEPGGTLRLVRSGLGVWGNYLHHVIGETRRIEIYRQTASTQDAARRLLASRRDARGLGGAVVVADEQTAGRGRLGRAWHAPAGTGLTFTYLHDTQAAPHFPPDEPPDATDRTTFAASVALCEALSPRLDQVGHPPRIKWPNDLYADDRKLAGILVERVGRHALIGVGINVMLDPADLPPDVRDTATSLAQLGVLADRLAVLADVLLALDRALHHTPEAALLDTWRQRCRLADRPAAFRSAGRAVTGTVIDLDPRLGLIVRRASGELVHLPAATTTVV